MLGGGALSIVAAALAAIGLYVLINRIEGHVRFLPLLAGLVLMYAIGKSLHLSPLILVLVCGLLLNNPHLIERTQWLRAAHTPGYDDTLREFKGLVAELTFATKSFFFLLLGYWTDVHHMADPRAWALAVGIVAAIYASRLALLRLLRHPAARVLVWVAPRGLITVLLFITAAETKQLGAFPFGTVMLVVLATASLTALARREPRPSAPANTAPTT
jgi:NhaP-type Na+/H+ or K+/H+ antiporter